MAAGSSPIGWEKRGFGIYEKTLYFLDPEYEKTFFRQNVPISRENKKKPGGEAWLPPCRASVVFDTVCRSDLRFLQLADLLDKNKKSEPFANRL